VAKVLLLHTGGTLGMVGTPLVPDAYGSRLLEAVPELLQLADIDIHIVCNLDSSDLGPKEWAALASTIAGSHEDYDGFVIVHGTDTMAYTAAALSYALEGLGKPIVFTGAQRPLTALRTDARRNLVDAVEVATAELPEVTICFDGLLLRGCRAVKSDARSYRAFASPGVPPLAKMGIDVDISKLVRTPQRPFASHPVYDTRVDVVYMTPGMRSDIVLRRTEDPTLRGLVIAAFGVGTVPAQVRAIAPQLGEAVRRGMEIIVVTQRGGKVDLMAYQSSAGLAEAGCLPGGTMHVEAAVPKLMHALARFDDRAARHGYLLRDVAGELG
jgi:L-asparaginase